MSTTLINTCQLHALSNQMAVYNVGPAGNAYNYSVVDNGAFSHIYKASDGGNHGYIYNPFYSGNHGYNFYIHNEAYTSLYTAGNRNFLCPYLLILS